MQLDVFGFATSVDRLVEDVAAAAAQGFRRFWTPQIRDLDALTAFAVVGREVPEIRLGTNVVPTWVRHPTMLAQQAITVNQAIGGRLDLGIGLSHKPVVEGFWGIPFERPVRHMSDYLKVLMPLLNGEPAAHTGERLFPIWNGGMYQVSVPSSKYAIRSRRSQSAGASPSRRSVAHTIVRPSGDQSGCR